MKSDANTVMALLLAGIFLASCVYMMIVHHQKSVITNRDIQIQRLKETIDTIILATE